MRGLFQCFLVALCSSTFALTIHGDDSDFIDEKGKALRHLKVVPGTKRNNVDFHTVEQEAGRAVLKLLDAKIGKKVNDAAKEVTDFLNDAVGHHADQRAANIQSDKQKEMSLLHLGAKKVLTNQDEENKPKKNKDGSFLVNFKIPYIVTPVDAKKEAESKKIPSQTRQEATLEEISPPCSASQASSSSSSPSSACVRRQQASSEFTASPLQHTGTSTASPESTTKLQRN